MENVYNCIKELKDQMNKLIEENADNLLRPEIIEISQKLDELIYQSMLKKQWFYEF